MAATLTPAQFVQALAAVGDAIAAAHDELCALDGSIGDGDHGVTMKVGFEAIRTALGDSDGSEGFAPICGKAAKAFMSATGGSAGPLYATALIRAGTALKDRPVMDGPAAALFVGACAEGVQARGKASPGDKTMLDAWLPAAAAAREAAERGGDVVVVLAAAAQAAAEGAEATRAMEARLGRASRLGQRSVGGVDPGAASTALILRALRDAAAAA